MKVIADPSIRPFLQVYNKLKNRLKPTFIQERDLCLIISQVDAYRPYSSEVHPLSRYPASIVVTVGYLLFPILNSRRKTYMVLAQALAMQKKISSSTVPACPFAKRRNYERPLCKTTQRYQRFSL